MNERHHRRDRRRAAPRAWAGLAVLLLAACGSDDDATPRFGGDLPKRPPSAPVEIYAAGSEVVTSEDTPVTFSLALTGPGATTGAAYVIDRPPRLGALTAAGGGTFTYTPAADANGTDSLLWHGAVSGASSNTATVSIRVTPANDPPVAAGLFLATDEGVAVDGMLMADDPEGDTVSFEIAAGSNDGDVSLNAGTGAFTFTPAPGFVGDASFTYRADDGRDASGPATVTVMVIDRTPPVLSSVSLDKAGAQTIAGLPVVNADDLSGNELGLTLDADDTAVAMQVTGDVVAPTPLWLPIDETTSVVLTPVEGPKRIWVRVRDELSNAGGPVGDAIGLDIDGPALSVDYPAYVSTVTFVAAVTASDLSPPYEIRYDGDLTDAAAGTWQALVTNQTLHLTAGEGPKLVTATARDRWDHASDPEELAVTLDQTPPTGTVELFAGIAGGDPIDATGSVFVFAEADFLDATSPVTSVILGGDIEAPGPQPIIPPATTPVVVLRYPVQLTAAEGIKTVSAVYLDSAGNRSAKATATVRLDTTPPSIQAVTLAGGAAITMDTSFDLAVSATGEPFEMTLTGEVVDPLPGTAIPYSPVTEITVLDGNLDGEILVWVRVSDELGNQTTQPVSDTVRLDVTPPPSPGPLYAAPTSFAEVSVTWTAVADADHYRVYYDTDESGTPYHGTSAAEGTSPIAWMPLTDPAAITLTTLNGEVLYVAVAAVDAAGNESGLSDEVTAPVRPFPTVTVRSSFMTYVTGAAPLATLAGSSPGYGNALAALPDRDGDGAGELLVGAPDAASGTAAIHNGATGVTLLKVTGTAGGEGFGGAVAAVGSMAAGDPAAFAVGASLATTGVTAAGRVDLRSGADGSVLWQAYGTGDGDRFGAALAGPGDLDLDGLPDVAVGAPDAASAATRPGAVYALSGSDGSVLFAATGPADDARFGAALAAAGDLAGDGASELLVGAPGDGAGSVRVLDGATGATVLAATGATAGDRFGSAVAGGWDMSGDGVPDLVVGAPGRDENGSESGTVYVLSGTDASTLASFHGRAGGDRLGAAVAAVADADGDGLADVLAAAPGADLGAGNAGAVYVLGPAAGDVLARIDGGGAGAGLGRSLVAAGDLDLDGVPDLAAGAADDATGTVRLMALTGPTRIYARAGTTVFAVDPGAGVVTAQVRWDGGAWLDLSSGRASTEAAAGARTAAFRGLDAYGDHDGIVHRSWLADGQPPWAAVFERPATAVTNAVTMAGTITDPTAPPGGDPDAVGGIRWAARLASAPTDLWWNGYGFAATAAESFYLPSTEAWSFAAPLTGPGEFRVEVWALDGAFQPAASAAATSFTYQP